MAVVVAAPEVAHAAAVIGSGVGAGAPLEVAGMEEPPLAEGDEKGAAAQVEGSPVAVAGKEGEPSVQGAPPAVEADVKGAAAPVEGALEAIKADGEEEGDDDVGENTVGAKGEVAAAEEVGEEKWLNHYSSMHSILIVGDGDFSFSLALATAFGSGANLVATSLDTYEVLRGKYSKAESNVMELKRSGATVLHGVDAKTMMFHTGLKNIRFDQIVFNFPHADFKGKEDDLHMINSHKELMWYFFYNARRLLRRYGEIHVTHKTGDPYDKWDLERVASECSLVLVMKVGFQKEDYPGYNQKRGDGARCDEPFHLATAYTFKFQIGDLRKLKKMNQNRARSVSNLGGRNVHPGQRATDAGPFHPLPPVEAWPPQPGQWAIGRGPSWNDLRAIGGIPPPMGRITYPNVLPPPEQPWYEPRTISDPPGSDNSSYFAREYQRSLRREYDMRRHLMPGSTSSNYSAFLEHRYMESVKKQEWLRSMIALYGRQ